MPLDLLAAAWVAGLLVGLRYFADPPPVFLQEVSLIGRIVSDPPPTARPIKFELAVESIDRGSDRAERQSSGVRQSFPRFGGEA